MNLAATLRRWFGDWVVAIVVAMVILLPLVRFDSSEHAVNRNVVLQLMGVLLFCTVAARVDWGPGAKERLRRFWRSGINAVAALFLLWALLSAVWVAPAGVGRAFAMNDLLRLGAGVLVYLVVANHLGHRRQLELLIDALLLIVALATLYRIFIPRWLPGFPSLIGTHLMAGAFLCLMLPLVASVAAAPTHPWRRIAAQVVVVLTVVCLLVSETRSSWIGAIAGMGVFAFLTVRHLTEGAASLWTNRHRAIYPTVALGGALVLMLTLSDLPLSVAARARKLQAASRGEDASFGWRLHMWQRTLGAIAREPWLGLGLGNYVLRQYEFTGSGQRPEWVARDGASMEEQVHNEYLHVAAELGMPGLLLYLLMLGAFFAKALHALGSLPTGLRKTLLIGCIAAVAAQCVDAASNPAWRFSVCSLYFWVVLGLGIALVRLASRTLPAREGMVTARVAPA